MTTTIGASGITFGGSSVLNPGGSAPSYACRVWVNFNGTGTSGNQALRGSGNVTSVTYNNTGVNTVNFATAMPDATYAIGGTYLAPTASRGGMLSPSTRVSGTYSTTAVEIQTTDSANTASNGSIVCFQLFR